MKVVAAGLAHGKTIVAFFIFTFFGHFLKEIGK